MSENLSHDAALDCIVGAAGVTVLSYEEAIDAYFRLRGLGDPASTPPSRPQGEEGLRDALAQAYEQGCVDTHKAIQADPALALTQLEWCEFGEAASDYAASALSNQGKPSS